MEANSVDAIVTPPPGGVILGLRKTRAIAK